MLTLITIRPLGPLPSRSISSRMLERRVVGATNSRRYLRCRLYPVRRLNSSLTSCPSSGSLESRPRSS